jgi:hypothetical protein
MMSDIIPITHTHMCGKAPIGTLGVEIGCKEKCFPDGSACDVKDKKHC